MDNIINKNSVSLGFIWLLPLLFQDKPPILMLKYQEDHRPRILKEIGCHDS